MHILQWTFMILTMCGCSRPLSWVSPFKKFLYDVYTVFVVLLTHSVVFSLILDIVFNVENQDDFSDNLYVTLAPFIACCKMCSFLINRGNIEILIDKLGKAPFSSAIPEEIEIRMRFERMNKLNAIAYTFLIESCITWIWITSFFTDFKHRRLVYRAWIPYDYSSSLLFTVAYVHQTLAITICSLLNVAYDTLYSGLLIHTYCQLEILGHRLENISKNENYSAKRCAHHHYCIYKFATMVNQAFKTITCAQFLTSMSIVCFNLYRLTQRDLGSRFIDTLFYAICILTEIFYYCWYGNEVRLKSLAIPDMVIKSDWVYLDTSTKKILLMIMRRASVPIEFTSIHVVSMNLECFMTLLKTSYSAYNVLQQGQG